MGGAFASPFFLWLCRNIDQELDAYLTRNPIRY